MPIANTGHAPSVETPTKSERARFFSTRMRIMISPMRKTKSLKAVLPVEARTLIAQAAAHYLTTDSRVSNKNRVGLPALQQNLPHKI